MTTEILSANEESELDTFENETEGYKFNYPKGWNIELLQGKVRMSSDLGVVIGTVIDGQLRLGYEPKNSMVALKLEKLSERITNSFELTEAKSFDKDYIKERFLEIAASESAVTN
jgi:hypothetical protein